MPEFEHRLRQLREERHLRQEDMADYLGIKLRGYQLYEHGEGYPTFPRLLLLADYFQVSLDYLVGRSDVKEVRK